MSGEWFAQVGQQEEWLYEAEARRIEDANEVLREMSAARDEEFKRELMAKYPILKTWPTKEQQ
jgi:hypothetical protein